MNVVERTMRFPVNALEYTNILLTTDDATVGATPKEVVWTHRETTLYRYRSSNRRYSVPVLLVFALINRPDIFDLRPGSSLVEFLVDEGFDVFLLDWGHPDEEDADMGLDNYVCDELDWAVRETLRASGAPQLTLLGWCIGATLCAMYCGLDRTGAGNRAGSGQEPGPADHADRRAGLHLRQMGWRPGLRRGATHRAVGCAARAVHRFRQQDDETGDELLDHVPAALGQRAGWHRPPRGLPVDGQVGGRQPALPRAGVRPVGSDDVPRPGVAARARTPAGPAGRPAAGSIRACS